MRPNRYENHKVRSLLHRSRLDECGCGSWFDPSIILSTQRLKNTANQDSSLDSPFNCDSRLKDLIAGQTCIRDISTIYSVPRFRIIIGCLNRNTARALDVILPTLLIWIMLIVPALGAERQDPLEPINRVTFQFNSALDKGVLKPAAHSYTRITPRYIRSGVGNFFSNLGEVKNLVNHLLQLNIKAASISAGRFIVNSSLGVGGLFEVAQPALGFSGTTTDFGSTLAHWGVGSGPYLVIPFLGPSTLRDTINLGLDPKLNPLNTLAQPSQQGFLFGARTVDSRSKLLLFDELIIGDEYLFVREVYLQSRGELSEIDDALVVFEDF